MTSSNYIVITSEALHKAAIDLLWYPTGYGPAITQAWAFAIDINRGIWLQLRQNNPRSRRR